MDPRVPRRRYNRNLLLQVLNLGLELGAGLLKRSVARKQRRDRRVRIALACDSQPVSYLETERGRGSRVSLEKSWSSCSRCSSASTVVSSSGQASSDDEIDRSLEAIPRAGNH